LIIYRPFDFARTRSAGARFSNEKFLNVQFAICNLQFFMISAIIPVKSLPLAKSRLGALLSGPERRALVLAMLGDVLAAVSAARSIDHIGVISADPTVLALAAAYGAQALPDQAPDLNAALTQAAEYYAERSAAAVLALPADIPLLQSRELDDMIAARMASRGMVIAPSRDGGTNALLAWPPLALPFLFGVGSQARHMAAAHQRGLDVREFRAPGMELDVDRPDDLLRLAETDGETETQQLARELCVAERVMCV
jgi:2-phospho-L-lactate/phosphoenolpyruvate guanylyltransferase